MKSRIAVSTIAMAALAMAVVPPVRTQNASSPAHVQLTRDEDFQRTRAMLGITTPPPAGAVSTSPDTFNETTANPFPTLPDPLKLNNGRPVTSAAMWNNQRRGELLEIFEREIYGRRPQVTPKVTWEVLS